MLKILQNTPLKADHLTYTFPNRKGYKFVGWNSKPDGKGTYFKEEQRIKN